MRVTILSRDVPPALSGIGDHTDRIATELAARGHAVAVVCSPPAEERSSFDVVPAVTGWTSTDVPAITRAVEATKPDVILWQYNPFSIGRRGLPSPAASLARALAGIAPLAVFAHELWFPWGRAGVRGLAWAVSQRRAMRAVLRAARAVIVTTEARERALAGRHDLVRRIPVGTNVDVAAYDARAALGLPADAFVLVSIGGAGPGKDLGPVATALERLRADGVDARLVLAGRDGAWDPPARLRDAVMATGTVADLSPYLNAGDVYVHPDPAGPSAGRRTSLVAALAHGLPLVAYDGPDRASEISGGVNAVLVPADAESLATALRTLHDDPARRAALGEAARATFQTSFTWRKISDEIEGLLVELGG